MVQAEAALAELRFLLSAEGPVDQVRCHRLLVAAASRIPDLSRAALLIEEAGLLVSSIDLVEILGGERQDQIDQLLEALDEIEELSGWA